MSFESVVATICVVVFVNSHFFGTALGQVDGIYCGKEICYDVLKVPRDADRATITKAYRALAKEVHPDRQKTEEAKKVAEGEFRRIANAYEILRDEEQRKSYDYMLDNPEAMYYHYYSYYRYRYAPHVDVRLVLISIITLISGFQYYGQWMNYRTAVTELAKVQRYRHHAKETAKERGLLEFGKKDTQGRKYTKEQLKEMEEDVIRSIVEEKMDIKGGYERPSLMNTLWLQLLCAPYYIMAWIYFHLRWFVLFTLLGRPYGQEEKLYLIRRHFNVGRLQFQLFSDAEVQSYLDQELWKKEKYREYAKQQLDEMRVKYADNNKFKRYRRFMRKGGPGQMSFGPED